MREVVAELEQLRTRSRRLLIAQRAAVVLAWALAAAAALILFDYMVRLPAAMRLVLLAVGLAALGVGLGRYVRGAFRFRPDLTQLALRAERVLPALQGRLATGVEFATAGIDQTNALAARSVREAQARLSGERVGQVLDVRRTRRDLFILLAVVAAVTLMAGWAPDGARTGLTRLFAPLSGAKWPARTGVESLTMGGAGSEQVYPRGQALALRARATKGAPDQRVDAHYRLTNEGQVGAWATIVLTHQGATVMDGALHERLIDTNADSVEVYFTTADDETKPQRITFVPPPAVVRATLTVQPPAYAHGAIGERIFELGPGTDDRSATDEPSLAGSTASLHLELNKPLAQTPGTSEEGWFRETFGWPDEDLPLLTDASDGSAWSFSWQLEETRSLDLNLRDEHGITNAEPISYRIEVIEDRAPSAVMVTPESDDVVLPNAVVPLVGEAEDDVRLAGLGLKAAIERKGGGIEADAWSASAPGGQTAGRIDGELRVADLKAQEGDVIIVRTTALDEFERSGLRHEEVQSPPRRLRVISELELATQLRRQVSAVRQNAIRIEGLQAELQEDVADDGVQPGHDRAQAQLGERVAAQTEAMDLIRQTMERNALDDPQLEQIIQQSRDLLEHAGRASGRAAAGIQQSRPGESAAGDEQHAESDDATTLSGEEPSASRDETSTDARPSEASGDRREAQRPEGSTDRGDARETDGREPREGERTADEQRPDDTGDDDGRSRTPQEQEILDAQQEVRDELTDLIALLDRDEDTWVVTRQLEDLQQRQGALQEQAEAFGERTMGKTTQEMTPAELSELDRIAQRQADLPNEARQLIEELRRRASGMNEVDPQAASGMRQAADTAEQNRLDEDMQNAAQRIAQNQMRSAGADQQRANDTMQRMLNDLQDTKRAAAAELVRQMASLSESITRLITMQENELQALGVARGAGTYEGLDRGMMRLHTNTQSVEAEARAAGAEARRIARSLDRAADAQGAAITALRAGPVQPEAADEAEQRSLVLLKEANAQAQETAQAAQREEVRRRREELMAAYKAQAELEVALRQQTLELAAAGGEGEMDRRRLMDARRLSTDQEAIRTALRDLQAQTAEMADAVVFPHVHRLIDQWAASASQSLLEGDMGVDVTDRQQLIADAIGRLIAALEESLSPPNEFANQGDNQQQQGGNNQGEQPPQPLIPPIAEIKLLQGLQEQVYRQTRDLDGRQDLDAGQRRARLRDLGEQQRDLADLGATILENMSQQGGGGGEPQPPAGDEGAVNEEGVSVDEGSVEP